MNKKTLETSGIKEETIDSNEYTQPFLPEGAKIVNNDIETGLTILDNNGNEWVWIVVPNDGTGPDYSAVESATDKDKAIESALENYVATDKNGNPFISREFYNEGGPVTIREDYADKWYAIDGNVSITEDTTNLTDSQKELNNGCGLTYSEYIIHRSEMLNSIKRHGGFYIGKYEVGYELLGETLARSSADDPIDTSKYKPVIKSDAYPYNFVTILQAESLAETLSSGLATTTDGKGSLLFGIQWDLILKYLESNQKSQLTASDIALDSTKWGNYSNNNSTDDPNTAIAITSTNAKKSIEAPYNSFEQITGTKDNIILLLTTGASNVTSRLNVYDIAGNLFEWTIENSPHAKAPCTSRGGNFRSNGYQQPAAYRVGGNTENSYYTSGFRVSIY